MVPLLNKIYYSIFSVICVCNTYVLEEVVEEKEAFCLNLFLHLLQTGNHSYPLGQPGHRKYLVRIYASRMTIYHFRMHDRTVQRIKFSLYYVFKMHGLFSHFELTFLVTISFVWFLLVYKYDR